MSFKSMCDMNAQFLLYTIYARELSKHVNEPASERATCAIFNMLSMPKEASAQFPNEKRKRCECDTAQHSF